MATGMDLYFLSIQFIIALYLDDDTPNDNMNALLSVPLLVLFV